jgi:hypothetical protein
MLFGLGAAVAPSGTCPAHPSHKRVPLARVVRLQKALLGLARRTGDANVNTKADGLVGRHTVDAINQALPYTDAPGTLRNLTRAQVVALAPQLAAWVEKAPVHRVPSDGDAPLAPKLVVPAPPPGGKPMPAYAPPQRGYPPSGYYPPAPMPYPGGYAPRRGPGGLPTDEASLDVRAFVPAQYEHLRIHPGLGMAVVVVGVVVVLMLNKDKKRSREKD